MNKNGFVNIILVIIIVVLVGIVGYFALVKKCPQPSSLYQLYQLLEQKLATGTPQEKEEVIDIFMANNSLVLVPSIIEAILDDTPLPRHGDTGWGNVYHQAATAMSEFAYKIDGIYLDKRGKKEFSFYDDVGTANEQRRKEVHDNWLRWWESYKPNNK